MKSVIVKLCAALVTGVYISGNVSVENAVLFLLVLSIVEIFRYLISRNAFSCRVPVISAVVIGIILTNYAMTEKSPISVLKEEYVDICGQVIEIPEYREDINVYIIRTENVKFLEDEYETNDKIKVFSDKKFRFGDSVRFKGMLQEVDERLNSTDFDLKRYYKGKGIFYSVYAIEAEYSEVEYKNHSVSFYVNKLKNAISERINKNYEGDDAAILTAVMTGYKKAFSEEFEEDLLKSNTTRLFYPTSIHLSLLAALVGLMGVYVKKRNRDIILIILVILYTIYNIESSFIVKTALLAAMIVYSKQRIGFSNYIELLAVIVGILVVINPLTAFETGFVVSVTANILVHYFMPIIAEKLRFIKNVKIRSAVCIWIIVGVGLLPLQMYYFGVTTPLSILVNMISMPLLGLLFPLALLNTVFCSIPPFSWTTEGFLYIYKNIPGIVARLPGYRLVLPETGLVGIVIFYLLLFIIYRRVYKGRKHDFSIKAAYMVIAGIVLSVIVNFGMKMDKLEINFVNVDQGDGAVLSIPFRETVIIDGGGTGPVNDYDFGKNVFLPYLKSNGHNVIDVAVVSHFHEDHCMGVIAAMEELKVRDVVISDTLPENENRRKIEMLAEEKGINLVYCKAGMRLKFESGMIMEFIAPDERDLRLQDENNTSFGIKVAYGDFSAIFTGDMSGEVENFHKGEWGDCDLIKVGHHGSKTSTTEEFIAETTPEVAVISLGKNNSYGFPKESVLSTLSKYGVSVFRTDINGDISVFADKNGKYSVKAFRVGDKPQ